MRPAKNTDRTRSWVTWPETSSLTTVTNLTNINYQNHKIYHIETKSVARPITGALLPTERNVTTLRKHYMRGSVLVQDITHSNIFGTWKCNSFNISIFFFENVQTWKIFYKPYPKPQTVSYDVLQSFWLYNVGTNGMASLDVYNGVPMILFVRFDVLWRRLEDSWRRGGYKC